MKKFDCAKIMKAAWRYYKNGVTCFAVALRMAWANAKAFKEAREAANVIEEVHTWYGWRELGYEVVHESKALFQVVICDPNTKSGTRKTSYFGASQVQVAA